MTERLELLPVHGLPEIGVGEDLASLILARTSLEAGDVVLVAQKVVSKAEGATTRPRPGEAPVDARRRLAREQARRIVVDTPGVLVTETPHGLVCANGGIDASNSVDGELILLPDDPDASARALCDELSRRAGVEVAVVITDTFGRPWRLGQTDVAIGLAGLAGMRDERGGTDRGGVLLEVTQTAVADELAAAADLTRRKADGVPVVVVRGFTWDRDPHGSVGALLRPASEDLFAEGAGMLAAKLAQPSPPLGGESLSSAQVGQAERVAAHAGANLRQLSSEGAPTILEVHGDRVAAGLVVAALLDLGCGARWRDVGGSLRIEAAREPAHGPGR